MGGKAGTVSPHEGAALDGFSKTSPEHALLSQLLAAMLPRHHEARELPWLEHSRGNAVSDAPRVAMVLAVCERMRWVTWLASDAARYSWAAWDTCREYHYLKLYRSLFVRLIRSRADYSETDLAVCLEVTNEIGRIKKGAIVGHVERAVGGRRPNARLAVALRETSDHIHNDNKLRDRIEVLLGADAAAEVAIEISGQSSWAKKARALVTTSPASAQWQALIEHAGSLAKPSTSPTWRRAQAGLAAALGAADRRLDLEATVISWLDEVNRDSREPLEEVEMNILRGLSWLLAESADSKAVDSLRRRISGTRLGIASIHVLGIIGSADAIRALFVASYTHPSKLVARNAKGVLAEVAKIRHLTVRKLEDGVGAREFALAETAEPKEDLEQAIYELPERIDLRAVLADQLIEAGDPRGEFIALQLSERRSKDDDKRIKGLLKEHGRKWLGPLEPVLQKTGLRFEGGFPLTGRLEPDCGDRLRPLIGHPAWSTFVDIDLNDRTSDRADDTGVVLEFLRAPSVHRLTSIDGLQTTMFADLCSVTVGLKVARTLSHVGFRYFDSRMVLPSDRPSIVAASALPALRSLDLGGVSSDPTELRWLIDSSLFSRLEVLRLSALPADQWISEFTKTCGELDKLYVAAGYNSSWHLTLERRNGKVHFSARSKGTFGTERALAEILSALRSVEPSILASVDIAHSAPFERTAKQLEPLHSYCSGLKLESLRLPKRKRG